MAAVLALKCRDKCVASDPQTLNLSVSALLHGRTTLHFMLHQAVIFSDEHRRMGALLVGRDETVRQTAWQMVAQLPTAALLTALTPEAWRSLFDVALAAVPRLHTEVGLLLRSLT